jgi:hypothetical protein
MPWTIGEQGFYSKDLEVEFQSEFHNGPPLLVIRHGDDRWEVFFNRHNQITHARKGRAHGHALAKDIGVHHDEPGGIRLRE